MTNLNQTIQRIIVLRIDGQYLIIEIAGIFEFRLDQIPALNVFFGLL